VPSLRDPERHAERPLRVVLFSGGRGSGALTRQLVSNASVDLTVAINGYDDGASTGEVRRFLGDALGPSDFRKNASTLARTLRTCPSAALELLDARLPESYGLSDLIALVETFDDLDTAAPADAFQAAMVRSMVAIDPATRNALVARLRAFRDELRSTARPFVVSDCSVGNLVFAGGFLLCGRAFNRAIDDYCAVVGLPPGLVENVTDGTNAWLIALDADGRLLATEEEIVDATRPNRVREIYLVDRPLTDTERAALERAGPDAGSVIAARRASVALNPRLALKIAAADLIIYAPGTQHSSLFPSYLTPQLADVIAGNLGALKVLVTNIESDAEITGSNAVDLIERAVYYLKNKGQSAIPTPFLITHSLLNDPARAESERPYVPLGPTEAIEDPRLVRIANYEDGLTGRHDAARLLAPFITSITGRHVRTRVAVLLHDGDSVNKIAQTMLEMVRGGIAGVAADVTVFYPGADAIDPHLAARLPFALHHLASGEAAFADAARPGGFDFVLLFESSGMYRGEETVPLLTQLAGGRLDAVWGSRRLSLRDIEESYRFRYRRNLVGGALSKIGSHVLSLACLLLYGRYVTDTLSGVRAVRAADALDPDVDLAGKDANQVLLARLLRRKAEVLETPVRFVPLSPERVKRTTALDGLRALATLVRHRFSRAPSRADRAVYAPERAAPTRPVK
jgi:2-phospho-L-lactate transferase/gluconeogenesis factor (CofD/UPF0052 family)